MPSGTIVVVVISNFGKYQLLFRNSKTATCVLQAGKPFYVSGGIFEEALTSGIITTRDISDVTNAILEGASGVCLSETPNSYNLCETINMLNELCASVEPLCMDKTDFCDLVSQVRRVCFKIH